jgi:hypothetical protein
MSSKYKVLRKYELRQGRKHEIMHGELTEIDNIVGGTIYLEKEGPNSAA